MKPNLKDFDDIIINLENEKWSQICSDCIKKLNISDRYLSNIGDGICGVKGCHNDNDSIVYVDFPK